MLNRSDCARRFVPALCLATLPVFALACSAQRPADTGADAGVAAGQKPQPANSAAEGQTAEAPAPRKPARGFDFPSQPPDGKWLTDELGRRYYVHEVAKIEGTYSKMANGTRVKFWYTPPFELVREDDRSFYVKIFAADQSSGPPPPAAATEPVEAAAKAATVESDRLRFEPWSQGLPTRGQWRQGFAVADVDGDGQLDIVHGPPRKGGTAPAIFLGDGKGHWRRWSALRMPDRPLDYGDAAAADFNGDGVMDLAFASHLKGLSVLVGDGKGGFRLWSEGLDYLIPGKPGSGGFSSRAIEVVDWNRDGRPDLLAVGEGPSLTVERSQAGAEYRQGARGPVVFLNQGDGTWKRQQAGGTAFGDALAIGRFDDDDRLDLLTASANMGSQSLLYVGREDGTLQETNLESLRPNSVFRAVAAADVDGDGREDLAVGFTSTEQGIWRTGVDVLLARPNARWERRTVGVEESQAGLWGLAAGDLDGDGAADLVAATGDGQLWVFLGDGKGTFAREKSPELAPAADLAGCTGYHVAVRDLDGDGVAEMVAGFAGEGGLGDALAGTTATCPSGGSLRAWKTLRESAARAR